MPDLVFEQHALHVRFGVLVVVWRKRDDVRPKPHVQAGWPMLF
jgi:hypothetical protein